MCAARARCECGALIRPNGCVAWALLTGRDLDAITLVRALGTWFGQPP
ncbi:aromatic-ring hydroxylase C-terminal domain-containing protein [Actinomadura rudentiformis]